MDYSTNNYTIEPGKNEDGLKCYVIRNINTDIIEYDDVILPRTIEAMLNLEDKLVEAQKNFHSTKLSLVGKSDVKEGSVH